jgi:hypothetical protein
MEDRMNDQLLADILESVNAQRREEGERHREWILVLEVLCFIVGA